MLALDSSNGNVRWSFSAGDGVKPQPLVTQTSIYQTKISPDQLFALDALSGATQWTYSDGDSVFFYNSITDEAPGTLFTCGRGNTLYSLNISTGALNWKYTGSASYNVSPLFSNGTVYLPGNDSTFCAINAVSGQLIWKFIAGENILVAPTLINGVLYFGCGDKKLYAINAATGKLEWCYITKSYIF